MSTKIQELAQKIHDNGFRPVPIGKAKKYPVGVVDWPSFVVDRTTINAFNHGVGIICGDVIAIDIDCNNEDLAMAMETHCLTVIGAAPVRVGKSPKRLLVYRASAPFLKGKLDLFNEAGEKAAVEILAAGQQFVAYGIHPDTGKPYQWLSNETPENIKAEALTAITEDQADNILSDFFHIAATFGFHPKASKQGGGKPVAYNRDDGSALDEVLAATGGNHDYDTWVRVGMALHHHFGGSPQGLAKWHHWSSSAENYDQDVLDKKWTSFDSSRPGGVTIATLFYNVKKRSSPDIGCPFDVSPPTAHAARACETIAEHINSLNKGKFKTGDVLGMIRLAFSRREIASLEVVDLYNIFNEKLKSMGEKPYTQAQLQMATREASAALKEADKEKKAKGKRDGAGWPALPHVTEKGQPLDTYENFEALMRHSGISIQFDVIKKRYIYNGIDVSDCYSNQDNHAFNVIKGLMNMNGIPVQSLDSHISRMGDSNSWNPVTNWIEENPWDGTDRVSSLLNAITVDENDISKDFAHVLIKKWMCSALHCLYSPDGESTYAVLVFQGEQNVGKTWWFNRLTPKVSRWSQDGVILNMMDKDTILNALSHWLVELGELDATFKRSDIAQLKAFITTSFDQIRRPYDRTPSRFPRKTAFFASVNSREFLNDHTGNRRFWTIPVLKIDASVALDMQQVWAQAYEDMYLKDFGYYLDEDQMALLNKGNEAFEPVHWIAEAVAGKFAWKDPDGEWSWMTGIDILALIGSKSPTQQDKNHLSKAVKRLNGGKIRRSNGITKYFVPRILPNCTPF